MPALLWCPQPLVYSILVPRNRVLQLTFGITLCTCTCLSTLKISLFICLLDCPTKLRILLQCNLEQWGTVHGNLCQYTIMFGLVCEIDGWQGSHIWDCGKSCCLSWWNEFVFCWLSWYCTSTPSSMNVVASIMAGRTHKITNMDLKKQEDITHRLTETGTLSEEQGYIQLSCKFSRSSHVFISSIRLVLQESWMDTKSRTGEDSSYLTACTAFFKSLDALWMSLNHVLCCAVHQILDMHPFHSSAYQSEGPTKYAGQHEISVCFVHARLLRGNKHVCVLLWHVQTDTSRCGISSPLGIFRSPNRSTYIICKGMNSPIWQWE